MKIKTRQTLLPAILLGGLLFTPGCSTPTTSIGVAAKSDRTVLSVSSPVPTKVQCVWQQDGARVQHQGTTPFRLAFSSSGVHEVSLSKPIAAAGVEVKIQPANAKPNRFAFARVSSILRLVRDGDGGWTSEQGSRSNLRSSVVVRLPSGESSSPLQDLHESLFARAKRLQ